ncbi:hypothetical protein [Caballeronia calidae]|uniref:hypothetical protein n=1 Tax=Caballeronia calidae TaxID=1777139 RepID=UPI000B0A97C9|nr:hypothetical protein [Caballeronia calidae]
MNRAHVPLRSSAWCPACSRRAHGFGVPSGTRARVKLAPPMFVGANLFIGYSCVRPLALLALARTTVSS